MMNPHSALRAIYYPAVEEHALFDGGSPRPQILVDSDAMKVLIVGLEAGQRIPAHPEGLAIYYFLTGEGAMTVDDEIFTVAPGVAVITPAGSARGVSATSRLVFLAAKAGA